jgi:YfiH family protein
MRAFWVEPDWPAPPGVRAASTLRSGGFSQGVYAGLNLGGHVGDDPDHVDANRRLLRDSLNLPAEPLWLNQVHGVTVVDADKPASRTGDAAVTRQAGVVCAVMTADCLPILLSDRSGTRLAAVHAGWRGLAGGVLEAAVTALRRPDLMAWLGPAIGPDVFEVGAEVRQAFQDRLGDCASAFVRTREDRWLADLYELARRVLRRAGVRELYGGDYCTHSDPERFYSYRRDGRTGRMATLIWRE